jgi:AhpD family alkylhydroperoxidase
MEKSYPNFRWKLQALSRSIGKEIDRPMAAFAKLRETAVADGALSAGTKELVALGIALCVGCSGCIAHHVHDALRAGATREEIMETLGIAVLMGGEPSLVYGCEALAALEQFEAVGIDVASPNDT